MKTIIKILAVIFLLVILLLAFGPYLFKDKISQLVQEAAERQLHAKVDFSDIGLSFFKAFPDACVVIGHPSIANLAPFEGDTLVKADAIEIEVELGSLISGTNLAVKALEFKRPVVHVHVLPDGQANWDIYRVKDSSSADTVEAAPYTVALQQYIITNADILYEDERIPMTADLKAVDHQGAGDLSASIFYLQTKTQAKEVTVDYSGLRYLNRLAVEADANLKVETGDGVKVTLMDENEVRANDLTIGLEGGVDWQGDTYQLDMQYMAKEADFKNVLSLVPGVFTEGYENLRTEGSFTLAGFVKGVYSPTRIPGFGFDLKIMNGSLQYPDLPKPLTNIDLEMSLHEPDGTFDRLATNISRFHANLGGNPIDGSLKTDGIGPTRMEGRIKGRLKLDELAQIFPMASTQLRGLLDVDAIVDGVYDEKKETFPQVDGQFSLTDGYFRNSDYPTEITDLTVQASLKDADQNLRHALLDVPAFSFKLDGEPIEGRLRVEDFADPRYELRATGTLDLDKLNSLYPFDSLGMSGKIIVEDFSTRGVYSDIEAERYERLPTSGQARVIDLRYHDPEVGPPLRLSSGKAVFSPGSLNLSDVRGTYGRSDFTAQGRLTNYLAYALLDDQNLQGDLQVRSQLLDLNELMADEDVAPSTGDEMPLEAIPVPAGLDISMQTEIGQLLYDDLTINNIKGRLRIAEEAIKMEEVNFDLLGAGIKMDGSYDTKVLDKPAYTFLLDVNQLDTRKAYEAFSTIRTFAPIARLVEGLADARFGISGRLGKNLMPLLETTTSQGFFQVISGSILGPKVLSKVASYTRIERLQKLDLDRVKGWFEIHDGYLEIDPIDLKAGDIKMTIGGRQQMTGELDYQLALDLPPGAIGSVALTKLSGLTGADLKESERIQLDLNIGGTALDPQVTGLRSNTADAIKDQLAQTAKEKLKEKLGIDVPTGKDGKSLEQTARDSVVSVVKKTEQQIRDSLASVAAEQKKKAEEKLKKELEKQLGGESKEKLDELKDLFKNPFGKKKKKN